MTEAQLDAAVFGQLGACARVHGWGRPVALEDGLAFYIKAEWSDFRLTVRRAPGANAYALACRFAVAPPRHRDAEINRLIHRLNGSLRLGRFLRDEADDVGICTEEIAVDAAGRSGGRAVSAAALRLVKSCDEVFPAFHIVAWTAARAEAAIDRTLYGAAGCA